MTSSWITTSGRTRTLLFAASKPSSRKLPGLRRFRRSDLMITRLTLIHAMSPLHAGTGQSVGAIDLPIARERPTGVPLLPGSSLKGALRALSKEVQITRDVFGPDTAESSAHAGSVQFSD